jgi:hypothetical protein
LRRARRSMQAAVSMYKRRLLRECDISLKKRLTHSVSSEARLLRYVPLLGRNFGAEAGLAGGAASTACPEKEL